MHVATYWCPECGSELFQEITSSEFTPLIQCQSEQCVKNRTAGKLRLQSRACKFVPFQELRIQEPSDSVPIGWCIGDDTIVNAGVMKIKTTSKQVTFRARSSFTRVALTLAHALPAIMSSSPASICRR